MSFIKYILSPEKDNKLTELTKSILATDEKIPYTVNGEILPFSTAPVILGILNKLVPLPAIWGYSLKTDKKQIFCLNTEFLEEIKELKDGIKLRRCLIPCSGFYISDRHNGKILFKTSDEKMFFMAGIYTMLNKTVHYTILTKKYNNREHKLHEDLPITISGNNADKWLYNYSYSEDFIFHNNPKMLYTG